MRKLVLYILISSVICVSSILIGLYLFYKQKDSDFGTIDKKVNELLDKNISIRDGNKVETTGFFSSDRMKYTLLSGGFDVYALTKESNGYVKSKTTATKIEFKESEGSYVSPKYGEGYLISGGYYRSNYRPSMQKVIDNAYAFLLKGNEKEEKAGYSPNKLTDIKNFPEGFSSKYFEIKKAAHPTDNYFTFNGSGSVYTPSYELSYDQTKEYFYIAENTAAISKFRIIYILISLSLGLLFSAIVLLVLKFINPHSSPHTDILDAKWRNKNDNSVVSIKYKNIGKYPVTILQDNNLKKGCATLKGNNLEIIMPDTEYFYEIINKTNDQIEMIDLINNSSVVFEKLKFKVHSPSETATMSSIEE
jgi:hypothetical protein